MYRWRVRWAWRLPAWPPLRLALPLLLAAISLAQAGMPPNQTGERLLSDWRLGPQSMPTRVATSLSLDAFRQRRRAYVHLLRFIRGDQDAVWPVLRAQNRVQKQFRPTDSFPCPASGQRSSPRPTSVHRLRPGDVDVVAAMGDSMLAGSGALALYNGDISLEDRGHAFGSGGWGTWRSCLTLPNILKVFNPAITGYATKTSLTIEKESRFNVAEPMAGTVDMKYQAEILRARMDADHKVNVHQDWKLVTLLSGANEMCSLCFEDDVEDFIRRSEANLIVALDTMMMLLPRTLVALVIVPDVAIKTSMGRMQPWCGVINRFECPCVYGDEYHEEAIPKIKLTTRRLQQVQLRIASMDRWRTREDFAVVTAPFLTDPALVQPVLVPTPTPGPGEPAREPLTDWSYFSTDCYHFSQKGHSIAANALWNNLLQPEGNKSTRWKLLFEEFLCPTAQRPYLCTWENC